MNTLVTYVIPSYNHAQYVRQAVQSVINQTYTNIELLIIDDGSSDESAQVIASMIKECNDRFVRFEFITQENQGLTSVLNFAVSWANGEYFCGVASDDINFPNKTSILCAHLSKQDVSAVAGGYTELDENGVEGRTYIPKLGFWTFDEILERKAQLYSPAAMFVTEAIKQVGGYDAELIAEDRDMWLSLSNSRHIIKTIPENVTFYRRHPENLSASTEEMIENRLKVYEKYRDHTNINKIKSRDLFGASRELRPTNKKLSLFYFWNAICLSPVTLFSKSGLRAIKAIIRGLID